MLSRDCGNYLESPGRGPDNVNKDFCLSEVVLDVHHISSQLYELQLMEGCYSNN